MNDDAMEKLTRLHMSGEILRLMLKKAGVSYVAFADYLKRMYDETGIRTVTTKRNVYRLTTERTVKMIYSKRLRDFLSPHIYDPLYKYFRETRPDEFYED